MDPLLIEADRWYVTQSGARLYVSTIHPNGRADVEYFGGNTQVNISLRLLAEDLVSKCDTPEPPRGEM